MKFLANFISLCNSIKNIFQIPVPPIQSDIVLQLAFKPTIEFELKNETKIKYLH